MTVNEKKLLMTLGLGARAGALISGTELVCEALRSEKKKPLLVIEASDTSENTHKRLNDKCTFYSVRIERIGVSAAELGHAIGKSSSSAAVGVTDAGICRAIEKKLRELSELGEQTEQNTEK